MRVKEHIAVSAVFSGGILMITRSWVMFIVSFLSGVLVDIDHVVDYLRQHPASYDIVHFFKTCEEYRLKRVYLWFHSIEFLALIGVVTYLTRSICLMGFMLGLAQHLAFDIIFNRGFSWTYFLVFRWKHGFRGEKVFDIPVEFRERQIGED